MSLLSMIALSLFAQDGAIRDALARASRIAPSCAKRERAIMDNKDIEYSILRKQPSTAERTSIACSGAVLRPQFVLCSASAGWTAC